MEGARPEARRRRRGFGVPHAVRFVQEGRRLALGHRWLPRPRHTPLRRRRRAVTRFRGRVIDGTRAGPHATMFFTVCSGAVARGYDRKGAHSARQSS